MIEFTIKTLESNNHQFSVEDETTVAQLKEQIREEMGIAIESQRLIFCGRVLTDDLRLSEFDVNGKVIHLVPRPPPSPLSRSQTHNPRQEMRDALEEAQRVIDRMSSQPSTLRNPPVRHVWSMDSPSELVLDQRQPFMSPTANRLDFIRRTIEDIRISLNTLSTHMANGNSSEETRPPAEPMEAEPTLPTEMPTETPQAETAASETAPTETTPAETTPSETTPSETTSAETRPAETPASRREANDTGDYADLPSDTVGGSAPPRRRPMRARPSLSRPRDLAYLIEELDQLDEQFAPFRANYLAILRDSSSSQLPQDERVHRQSVVELVCDVMHSFSHAYHAVSDISVTVGERFPRLTSGFSAIRNPIPVQAHINVVHTSRRPGDANPGAAGTAATAGTATANRDSAAAEQDFSSPIVTRVHTTPLVAAYRAQRSAAAAAAAAAAPDHGASEPNPLHSATGRNTNQAAHNHPEPITYQVEIETRVPIALPIDTALLNGLAAVATSIQQEHNLQQGQGQEQSQGQAQGQGQPQAQSQGQTQPQSQDQAPGQTSRPRVLTDVENLLRTLGQAHPGLEVVMSMEQIHTLDSPPPSNVSHESQPFMSASYVPGDSLSGPESGAPGTGVGTGAGTGTGTATGPGTDTGAATGAGTGTAAGAAAGRGAGVAAGRGAGRGAGLGVGRGAGLGAPGFVNPGGPQFGSFTFGGTSLPAGFSIPGFGVPPSGPGHVTPDGVPTFTPGVNVGVASYGPATFTIQPDGGVFFSAISGENNAASSEAIRNMFTSMFGQPTSTAAASPQATSSPTTTPAAAPGTPSNTTTTPSGLRLRMPHASTAQNAAGWTTDAMLGISPGQFPDILHLENVSTSPSPGQTQRLGPLSAMARARTLQQAEERRRNAARANGPQGSNPQSERNPQSGNNARAHHLAMACMVYDRYLNCESLHARQRLSERRVAYQELLHNHQMRQRARPAVPDIDQLGQMNPYFRPRYMACMMRLLCGRACLEARVNAFLVSVARVLFLEPEGQANTYDPTCMPREFLFVRMQMRDYVQRLLEVVITTNARSPFEGVASLILNENRAFINRMNDHTPIDPLTDPMVHLRSWLRARMPAIIACVMTESASDMFVSRFYGVCARFFRDLCSLIMQFCVDGFDGFSVLFNAFFAQLSENFEPTAREWIRLLARENLNAIRIDIDLDWSPLTDELSRGANLPSYRSRVCCLYEVNLRSEDYRLSRRQRRRLPHICEHHQRTTLPVATLPVATLPILPAARNDTPDTLESLPSMSIPTMSSESDTSGSPQPPEADDDGPTEALSNEDGSGSPQLQERTSGADTVSTTSHNSVTRSPVQTRSAGTSPRHETPVSAPQNVRHTEQKESGLNGPNEQNRHSEQAGALSPSHDRSQNLSPRSSPDSMRFAPPVMFLEHWGEEWVPVFTRDQRTQCERSRPQEPHSDAYLSGMPSRKRRCLRASRPPITLDGFINESARESTERSISLDPAQLRGVVRDSVRNLVRTRADVSEDFDPVRYAAAARLLDQTKQEKKESENKPDKLD